MLRVEGYRTSPLITRRCSAQLHIPRQYASRVPAKYVQDSERTPVVLPIHAESRFLAGPRASAGVPGLIGLNMRDFRLTCFRPLEENMIHFNVMSGVKTCVFR